MHWYIPVGRCPTQILTNSFANVPNCSKPAGRMRTCFVRQTVTCIRPRSGDGVERNCCMRRCRTKSTHTNLDGNFYLWARCETIGFARKSLVVKSQELSPIPCSPTWRAMQQLDPSTGQPGRNLVVSRGTDSSVPVEGVKAMVERLQVLGAKLCWPPAVDCPPGRPTTL